MTMNNKWRLAAAPVLLVGMAVIPAFGCEEIQNAQNDICCREFTPGADLASVEWGLDGQAELNYGAFMQAVSDFTGAAGGMVADVTSSCRAIAVDLGASEGEVTETEPDKRASAWCALAVARIGAVGAQLSVRFQPPSCTVDVSAQASCEARCSANVECTLTPAEIIARCDPGKLSGRCTAKCQGSCEGSANLAVNCQGSCAGTCEGDCNGKCSATGMGGECRGACEGTCNGQCRGSCEIAANADVTCNADCTGGCSVEYEAPKCTAQLSPPKAECQGSAECSGSCDASASARAQCKEPSIEISGSGDVDRLVSTLRLNLPRLLLVAQARGRLLLESAEAVVELGGNLGGSVGGSVKAGACLVPAGTAIDQAARNINASLNASLTVMGSVGIAPQQ